MAVQENLVSSNASSANQYGVQITTGAIVTDLSSTAGSVQLQIAIDTVGYSIGTNHPIYAQYKCVDIDARSIGPNEVQITYTWDYKFPDIRYEIGSTLSSIQTNYEADGTLITASYTYPTTYKENPELAGESFTTSILVDKLVTDLTLTITRQEAISGFALLGVAQLYTGVVNTSYFMKGQAFEWLCTGVSGSSQDNGVTYSVRYSFSYRKSKTVTNSAGENVTISGWDKEVVFVDPRTDQPPADELPDIAEIYESAEFHNLGLV